MWRVLLCDNDTPFLESFKRTVVKVAGEWIHEIKTFERKDDLEFYVGEHPLEPYIILLDVELEDGSGVDAAREILSIQPNAQIIFMSEYDKHYLDVYEVEHVYFLKKPINEILLRKAIQRAGEKLELTGQPGFIVKNKKGIQKINLNEILYFEKEKRKIHVHTEADIVTYYGKFKDMVEQLDYRFLRCHNSYIVNMNKVKKLSGKKFFFEAEGVVPISRSYYSKAKEAFLEYVIEGVL